MAVELTEKQKQSPLYKYYQREIEEVPQDILEHIMNDPFNTTDGLPIEEMNRMFDDGYLPGEFGLFQTPDGGYSVANLVDMPGVTPEMFDWWFAWHGLDSMRYTIWDKDDHYYVQTQNPEIALNENLSMRERYWHTVHDVKESMAAGAPPADIQIHFIPPWEAGFDKEKFENFDGTIICSTGTMVHFVRRTATGCELRTRFWIGHFFNGETWVFDKNRPFPADRARNLLAHNWKEFHNLAKILPEVYAEFKDNFLVDVEEKYKCL